MRKWSLFRPCCFCRSNNRRASWRISAIKSVSRYTAINDGIVSYLCIATFASKRCSNASTPSRRRISVTPVSSHHKAPLRDTIITVHGYSHLTRMKVPAGTSADCCNGSNDRLRIATRPVIILSNGRLQTFQSFITARFEQQECRSLGLMRE